MDMVVIQNFRAVDRLLAKPTAPAAEQLRKLGAAPARMLLRHQVSEQNRWYFEAWGLAGVMFGLALLLVLLFGSSETKVTLLIALLMFLFTVLQRFALTPEMVALGRVIDWVPQGQQSAERATFWLLDNAYVGLELLNFVLGFSLAAKLILRRARRGMDQDLELMEQRSMRRGG
jgi:hypothetical protein